MDKKFPEYNLLFDDVNYQMDNELIKKYPTLFYFFNKNILTYQQIKDNFKVKDEEKLDYGDYNPNNPSEFNQSFYFWIFALRILSSINAFI